MKYMIRICGESVGNIFCPRLTDDIEYVRLVKLNKVLDGVCLVNMDETAIVAISLQDIRRSGFIFAFNNKKQTFYEKVKMYDREWIVVDGLPVSKYLWCVIANDDFALWMDNDAGEMYLVEKKNKRFLKTSF